MLDEAYINLIAREARVPAEKAKRTVMLFDGGATIPFVARYRKDVTGGLDEERLERVYARFEYWTEFVSRKQFILETIEKQKQLDDGLRERIMNCYDRGALEDLYLPYKKARRTKATVARERGLAPLAEILWHQPPHEQTLEEMAAEFVDASKGVNTPEEAIAGAEHIVSERVALSPDIRTRLRKSMLDFGTIKTSAAKSSGDGQSKFEGYHNFEETIREIPSHRFLAVQRGVKEGKLRLEIEMDDTAFIEEIIEGLVGHHESVYVAPLRRAVDDAYHRVLRPSIVNDVLKTVQRRADEEAVRVFRSNAENLLLAAPAGKIPVIGLDPGHKSGCKLAVVDEHGAYIESAVIFPTPPEEKIEEATAVLSALIDKHGIRGIAVGSGTGSRESAAFVRQVLAKRDDGVIWALVNEAGASIYSASPLAREEYPDIDVTIRGAVSIAHRLQDPLAELVKIEPKHIGVGQYQHDVDQRVLRDTLHRCVVNCVSRVGVNLNTASAQLLRYVSGIRGKLARNIVRHREANGSFKNRQELLAIEGIGPKVFEQSAGFLRIQNGDEPLDATGIHPEAYSVVSQLAEAAGVDCPSLIGKGGGLDSIDLSAFVSDTIGLLSLEDIREELARPARDPRSEFRAPNFDDAVYTVDQLEEGKDVEGVVTNVTDFGAFVDIGVKQDGLVHLSELAPHFVRDPHTVVRVGDIVKVRVIKVEKDKPRISLSMKALLPPKEAQPSSGRRRRGQPGRADGDGSGVKQGGDGRKPARGKPRGNGGRRDKGSQGKRPAKSGGKPKAKEPSSMNTALADQLAALRDKFDA